MNADDCLAALPVLVDGAERLGISVPAGAGEQFARYCELLVTWNSRINLTGIREPEAMMRTLFLDALVTLAALPPAERWAEHLRVVDVGSGAGLPGIPWKIARPHWQLVLVESVGKKASFLREAAGQLGLDGVTVVAGRAEEVGRDMAYRETADLGTARAVARLATLLELCAPLVRVGGILAFPKSGDMDVEAREAQPAAEALKLELLEIVPEGGLQAEGAPRGTVLYRKLGPTPPAYPRRTGLPASQPLGGPAQRGREAAPGPW